MNYDLFIVDRLVADRQHALRSTAAAGRPGGHHPTSPPATLLHRSFGTTRRRRSAWGRRWPT